MTAVILLESATPDNPGQYFFTSPAAGVTATRFIPVAPNHASVTDSPLRQVLRKRRGRPADDLLSAPDNRELRALLAKKYGRFCGKCGASLERFEWVWYGYQPWRSHLVKTTVCMDCGPDITTDPDEPQRAPWYRSGHCTCGRMVFRPGTRVTRFHCSDRCYWNSCNRQRQQPKPRKRHCAACGISFTPAKDTAKFHSNACRQKTYRQRAERFDVAVEVRP